MSTTGGWGAALRGCGVGIACRRGVRGTGIPAGSGAVDGATTLAAGRRRARVAGTELADDGPAAVGVAEAAAAGVAGFARARVADVAVAGLVGAGAAGLVRARAAGVAVLAGCVRARATGFAVLAGCVRARATGFAAAGVVGSLRARVAGVARAAVAGFEGAGVAGFRARAAAVPLGEVAGAAAPAAVARFEVAREREVFVAPGVDSVFTVDGFVDLRRRSACAGRGSGIGPCGPSGRPTSWWISRRGRRGGGPWRTTGRRHATSIPYRRPGSGNGRRVSHWAACRTVLSPPQEPARGTASTPPVKELRR